MKQYKKTVDVNNKPMYFDGEGTRVAGDKVPAEVASALDNQPEGIYVTEELEIVKEETPEAPKDGETTETGDGVEPAPTNDKDEDDEEDDSDEDDEEPEAPKPVQQHPVQGNSSDRSKPMGFPTNDKGQTLSVFSKSVHETVKFVFGLMVPMTHKELVEKDDTEIGKKLRKLGKL